MLLQARRYLTVLTVVTVGSAAAPVAADQGFYVGAIGGVSKFHQGENDLAEASYDALTEVGGFPVTLNSSSFKRTDSAFGGLVGYRFTPLVSVEVAYVDLGQLRYTSNYRLLAGATNGFAPFNANLDLTAKAHGPTLSGLVSLPLSRAFELYGRAGLFFSTVKLEADIAADGFSGSDSVSGNSVDPLVGAGAAWHVAGGFALRAEYTRFINVGDKNKTGQVDIDLFNVGVTYSFR